MRKFLVVFMILSAVMVFAEEKVKLGFYVREGESDLSMLRRQQVNLIVTFDETVIFDTELKEWIARKTAEDGKAPNVTVDGLQREFFKSLDSAIKRGKPVKRINSKSEVDRGFLLVANLDRVVPVPMIGHTLTFRISVYNAADMNTPVTVMTLQYMEDKSGIPGRISDNGIGRTGSGLGAWLVQMVNNPKIVRTN